MQRWTQPESGEEGVSQAIGSVCDSAGERTVWQSHMCSTLQVFPVWGLSKPWWSPGIGCPWVPFCPLTSLLPLSPVASTASLAMAWCPAWAHLAWVTLNPGSFLQQGHTIQVGKQRRDRERPSQAAHRSLPAPGLHWWPRFFSKQYLEAQASRISVPIGL